MILLIIENQKIHIKITRRNINHYRQCGYDVNVGDEIDIKVTDLISGSHIKVNVKCDYCGKVIQVAYRDYIKYKFDKYSCQKCRQQKTSEYNLKTRQRNLYNRAINFCKEKGYELITNQDEIFNSDTRVLYKCPKHGVHETKIYTLITEHECINCAIEHNTEQSKKTPDMVYNEFKKYGGILLNKEDYLGWNYKNLKVICPECKEIFTTSYCAFTHRNGQVCSKCSSRISKGERKIKDILEKNNVDFYREFRFDDCRTVVPLPFDFYLPKYNLCIEYDGEGHYMPIRRGISLKEAELNLHNIQKRDNIKTEYCKDNNITLIRIPYWDFNNIENILKEKVFT